MSRSSDKRVAAYESIFGRPTPSHSQPSYGYGQPQAMYYNYNTQQYQNVDPRSNHAHQQYSSPYRQSYAIPPPVQYTLQPPINNFPPRARSVASNPHNQGIIAPRPEEPPDPALQTLMSQQGLTAAQAYQAQVYLNSPHQNGTPEPPTLGLNIGNNQGRLDLNFNGSDRESDDESELPWARRDSRELYTSLG